MTTLSKLKEEGREEFEKLVNSKDDLNCPYCDAQNFNEQPTEHKSYCPTVKYQPFISAQIEKAYLAGRSDALDEEYDKAEELGEVAEANYSRGYNDCKKGRKPAPHETRYGYCCACDYDMAGFEADKKEAYLSALSDVEKGLPKEKTTGILGILGTTHRDGVVNEGFNSALSAVKKVIKKLKERE